MLGSLDSFRMGVVTRMTDHVTRGLGISAQPPAPREQREVWKLFSHMADGFISCAHVTNPRQNLWTLKLRTVSC